MALAVACVQPLTFLSVHASACQVAAYRLFVVTILPHSCVKVPAYNLRSLSPSPQVHDSPSVMLVSARGMA